MTKPKSHSRPLPGRRRFLGLFGGTLAAGLSLPMLSRRPEPRERDLREADFYRPHDLAG
jgi:hypothetical protein